MKEISGDNLLNRKANIFKYWWFNFIIIPVITIIYALINFFTTKINDSDQIILTWFTIMIMAFILQLALLTAYKQKNKFIHYLYILIVINISLFIGYILSRFVIVSEKWWKKWLVNPALVLAIIYTIQEFAWYLLVLINYRSTHKNKIEQKNDEHNRENVNP